MISSVYVKKHSRKICIFLIVCRIYLTKSIKERPSIREDDLLPAVLPNWFLLSGGFYCMIKETGAKNAYKMGTARLLDGVCLPFRRREQIRRIECHLHFCMPVQPRFGCFWVLPRETSSIWCWQRFFTCWLSENGRKIDVGRLKNLETGNKDA